MEIVIVSAESRRRDNLLCMLESIVPPSTIKLVETCRDVLKIANPVNPATVFINYVDPDLVIEEQISSL